MSDVFISYARSTEPQARRIADALRALGYDVWTDSALPAHRSYARVIEERLDAAKAVLVVWSAEAARSDWVQAEADRARAAGKLVQLTLDRAALPMPFDRLQCADLVGWNGERGAAGWEKVVASIAELTGRDASTSPLNAAAPAPRVSICVLPFVNMSGEADQDYFSDGISEDITTDLSKVSALSVAARNTAFTYKNRSVDVRQVARELGVSHVLEGSVRRAGSRMRITAQLIDGAAGDHIWAERYDRDLTDIFALQDEISQTVVAALKLKLLPNEKKAIETRGTASAQAYDFYLMARQYRDLQTDDPSRHETIVRFCERAIAIDPAYAQAWSLMASSKLALLHNYGRVDDGAADAVEHALRLDPDLGEAHALKARLLFRAGQRDEAFSELELALRQQPDSHDVNLRAGMTYYEERRFSEAIHCLGKAASLDEGDFSSPILLLSAHFALGDQENARQAALMALGRVERAVAQGNRAAMAQGVLALAALGRGEEAREWIDRALLLDPGGMDMRYNFACALSLHLQDAEGAIALLDPAFASSQAAEFAASARSDPDLDPIRDDPRFQAMLARAETRPVPAGPDTPP